LSLPFIYNYAQNPYVRLTEDGKTFNATAVKQVGYFIAADDPAPTGPQEEPDLTDPRCVEVLGDLEEAFGLRPVWTRRSLMNFLGMRLRSWNELKRYLNYKAYQFKGGPWRDVVIPYGIDPRTDPKYRIYQTLMFKLQKNAQPGNALQRYSLFGEQDGVLPPTESHVFDGETYYLDGKVWQVCDITDPLLKQMFDDAAIREERHGISGWYHGGLWAKAKAIMKTKLVAIRFGRKLTPMDFASIMQAGDRTPTKSSTGVEPIRLPNLGLTRDELTEMYGKHPTKKKENRGYSVKVREPLRSQELEEEPVQGPGSRDDTNQWPAEEDDEDDNDDDEEADDDEHDEDNEDDEEDADENEGETDIGDLSGQHMVAERHAQYPDLLPRPVG
jgi:general transcription factor 3C polypeptide 5 (transcription factor C subunit 1)